METVPIAPLLTEVRSRMNAATLFTGIESLVERVATSWHRLSLILQPTNLLFNLPVIIHIPQHHAPDVRTIENHSHRLSFSCSFDILYFFIQNERYCPNHMERKHAPLIYLRNCQPSKVEPHQLSKKLLLPLNLCNFWQILTYRELL